MEMKENNQKKVLLSVLGVAILVVAVVGISMLMNRQDKNWIKWLNSIIQKLKKLLM